MAKTYLTADLHIGHENIFKHQKDRLNWPGVTDCASGDQYLIDLWRKTVTKHDTVYILGDLTFRGSEDARKLLNLLPGRKFLIRGNHDGSLKAYDYYFVKVADILELEWKPTTFPFITEDRVRLVLCHYPMVTWNHKPDGAIMVHGHCHGYLDKVNEASHDLRFDVGVDGALARKYGIFIPAEAIYEEAKAKTGGLSFCDYAKKVYTQEEK